ncbi:TPA: hypothetical protein DIC20_04945 [Candidatus Dependentiae bacterium]|nr:MAG: hypothetical protein US03_C0007G0047 [candidate division TM6 bacterium GW2011_GWF2_36_131]KKQ03011.1 MAG: hypothetical protein US13_C0007G0021 [candidate division TM6 bacterium GW2011_GWE2_36_25]KKQ19568.1 MAG: hypothetical protein US32_C0007G0021 [candidate division TM6 bacterium GW2011_GWA2_36_9]HBR71083.1 hypothetical protein [Candidatus Dependentiae bacterium]HCU01021.1 hypothetical protein [Candidatus Dependentiae bacterium]
MFIKNLKENWKAGLSVALVSIPLSISLAVASNSSPTAGIITAIWAGLVASIFGGSNFNIVGPTGALSGTIAAYGFMYGMNAIALLTIIAGFFIIAAYFLKLERYLIFVPSSVIHGFTLGIAFVIGLSQLNYAVGLKPLPKHEELLANIFEACKHLPEASLTAFLVFLFSFTVLLLFRRYKPHIPGAILLTPFGILLGYLGKTKLPQLALETLGDRFSDISFKLFIMPDLSWHTHVLQTAVIVALIAILETMLSAKIADSMTHTKHNPRNEMLGLGLANIASGITGGIPATAALARTSLNIKTHATNKLAATLNSIFIAFISFFLLIFFKYLPLSIIAAILVYVAVQMVEAEHFVNFFKYERFNFWVSIGVAIVTIYKDPIAGILVGSTLSLLFLIDKIAKGQCEIKINKRRRLHYVGEETKELDKNSDILVYSLKGKLCYINSRAHIKRFETDLTRYSSIVLNLQEIYFIDLDGAAALDEIIELARARGQKLVITQCAPHIASLLELTSQGYQKVKKDGLIFNTISDALHFFEQDHQNNNQIN